MPPCTEALIKLRCLSVSSLLPCMAMWENPAALCYSICSWGLEKRRKLCDRNLWREGGMECYTVPAWGVLAWRDVSNKKQSRGKCIPEKEGEENCESEEQRYEKTDLTCKVVKENNRTGKGYDQTLIRQWSTTEKGDAAPPRTDKEWQVTWRIQAMNFFNIVLFYTATFQKYSTLKEH